MEQAVHTLYYGQCPNARREAEILLEKFRNSDEAWEHCDVILSTPENFSPELRFFAAQTICTKVQKDRNTKPAVLSSLFVRLLLHARQYVVERPCMRQLCLAIGYAAQKSVDWPADNIIEELYSALSPPESAPLEDKLCLYFVLLEILAPLTAECMDARVVAGASPQRRESVKLAYERHARTVFELISRYYFMARDPEISHTHTQLCTEIRRVCMNCIESWTNFAGVDYALEIYPVAPYHLFDAVIMELSNELVCPAAASALSVIVKKSGREPKTVQIVARRLLELVPDYQVAHNLNNSQVCKVLALAYVQAGKTYIPYLCSYAVWSQVPELSQLLDINVSLLAEAPFEIAGITFTLWCHLRDSTTTEHTEPINYLDIYFTRAIEHVVMRARYPEDFNDWPPDTREEFFIFRREIRDVVRLIVVGRTPGSELEFVSTLTTALIRAHKQNDNRSVEALLHGLSTVAKQIPATESPNIAHIMEIIPQLPHHPAIARTSLLLISVYSHWLRAHPQHVAPIMASIVIGFGYPENAPVFNMRDKEDHVAALAFMKTCGSCAVHLRDQNLVPDLINAINALSRPIFNGKGTMTVKSLGLALDGLGQALTVCCVSLSGPAFALILEECFTAVRRLLNGEIVKNVDAVTVCNTACSFVRACSFNDNVVHKAHPVAIFLETHWECIGALLETALSDEETLESLCRLLTCAMESLVQSETLDNVVPHIVSHLLLAYAQAKHASLLLALKLPVECSRRPALRHTLQQCASTVFSSTTGGTLGFKGDDMEHSQLLSAFCTFAIGWGDTWPHEPETDIHVDLLLSLILKSGLVEQQKPGGHAVASLLECIWAWSVGRRECSEILKETLGRKLIAEGWGVRLVKSILEAVNGAMPSWMLDSLSSALHECNSTVGDELFSHWLLEAISENGFPRDKVSPEAKLEFSVKLLQEGKGPQAKRNFKSCVKAFCGGKKKGTSGMPSNHRNSSTA